MVDRTARVLTHSGGSLLVSRAESGEKSTIFIAQTYLSGAKFAVSWLGESAFSGLLACFYGFG